MPARSHCTQVTLYGARVNFTYAFDNQVTIIDNGSKNLSSEVAERARALDFFDAVFLSCTSCSRTPGPGARTGPQAVAAMAEGGTKQ
jgi:hypothetical protein